MKKIKLILIPCVLLFLGANSSFFPNIVLDRFPSAEEGSLATSVTIEPYVSISLFPLALGQSESQLKNTINKVLVNYVHRKTQIPGEPYTFSKQKLDTMTELIQVSFDSNFGAFRELKNKPEMMGLYILKEGLIVGYACTDIHVIEKPQEFIPWVQITHLSQDKSFLPGFSLPAHPERQIRFYQVKRQDSYIERYATLNLPKADNVSKNNIVLRSFYPQEYEVVLKPLLKQSLESILWRYGDMFEYL